MFTSVIDNDYQIKV